MPMPDKLFELFVMSVEFGFLKEGTEWSSSFHDNLDSQHSHRPAANSIQHKGFSKRHIASIHIHST